MRTLVTGGAGFIGSNLVDALVKNGDEVVVVDDLSTGYRANLEPALEQGAELVTEDVTNADAMLDLLEKHPADRVFHLAAQIDVRKAVADPGFDARINVNGTISMLEAARRSGQPRFVFVSTGGALYGEGEGRALPLGEDAECLPTTPYGLSKLAAEGYVSLYARERGLSAVSLRLANVYGPRQDPLGEAGVIAIFCGKLAAGERPTVFGDGRQTRDFTFVDDVVDALLTASTSDAAGAYNVGTGSETTVLELVELLGRIGDRRDFEPIFENERDGEVKSISLDSSKAAQAFGWRATTGIADGLERTWTAVNQVTA